MTLEQAIAKAIRVSKECGCVQHVEKFISGWTDPNQVQYTVSDWYDYETTVASYSCGNEMM